MRTKQRNAGKTQSSFSNCLDEKDDCSRAALSRSVILNPGSAVRVYDAPIPQSIDNIRGDACGAKITCRSPDSASAYIAVRRSRLIVVLNRWEWQILGDGILQILIHPCGQKRFDQRSLHLGRERLENRLPFGADHDARVDALIGTPTLAEVVWAQAWIGGLKRLGNCDKQAHWFGLM